MHFQNSIYKSLRAIEFRTTDHIYETNKNGFHIRQNELRPTVLSVELHDDGYGGTVFLSESIDISEPVYVYYGDRDFVLSLLDDKVYSHPTFEEKYTYDGALGAWCDDNSTYFSLWSPLASHVALLLFHNDTDQNPYSSIPMEKSHNGVFSKTVEGDFDKVYYLYEITIDGKINKTIDPYAKASGVNSHKSMTVNLLRTNPEGFDKNFHVLPSHQTDAVLYEISVRDFTISSTSGVDTDKRGKFSGFAQKNTLSPDGNNTTLSHLKELGITHVHLMPVMDFATVNEEHFDHNEYNWGYDPVSYFNLEGSYSGVPSDGSVRIREFKQLVKTLHENGIGVVLDVVYNHTYHTMDSSLNLTAPNYYYRMSNGGFSNGSGCGNELDTQKSMVRNLILNSIKYWVNEYAIDGFRFDLMGLMDIQTSNMIREALDQTDPRIIMYGEGWTGGASTLSAEAQTNKYNSHRISSRIGLFNDEFRDAIKGDTFKAESPGYAVDARDKNRQSNFVGRIMAGIVAQTPHPSVNYNGHMSPYATSPNQTVNYHSAHDNYTLHDKLMSCGDWVKEDALCEIYKFCAALVLTSQGIPFLMGGEEFMRSKKNPDGSFNHNSYNSSDTINEIDWNLKQQNNGVFEYYKGLISLRKSHSLFRIHDNEILMRSLQFINLDVNNCIGYVLSDSSDMDSLNEIVVLINPNVSEMSCDLSGIGGKIPTEFFSVFANKYTVSSEPLYKLNEHIVTVEPVSVMVLGR